MKHNRERDAQKVLTRKRMWDFFHWGYNNQLGRLNKNHWLKCGCSWCQYEQYLKYHEHVLLRRENKRVINEQLDDIGPGQ
jgi:hypothetical protein